MSTEAPAPTAFSPPGVAISARTIVIAFPVQALPQDQIIEGTFQVAVGAAQIRRVWSFLGVDQGNLGEFAIDVTEGADPVYQRSYHKECLAAYDAWDSKDLSFTTSTTLTVHVLGHCTGHPGRVQFELRLETGEK